MQLKKVFLGLLICTLFSASYGQFRISIGAGASIGRSPEIEAAVGYNWKLITVTGQMQVATTNKVTDGAVFELKFGHEVTFGNDYFFSPFVGAAYHYNSSDFKNLNITRPLFGLEIGKMFREDIGMYGSFSKTGNLKLASIGVRGVF